jgi:hypothetical protein
MVKPFSNSRIAPGTLVSRLRSRYAHPKPAKFSRRPAQGKLILFPPFWTHVHRGVTLARGVKYIATTWICFA